jgi:signal transduction histidine kinase
VRRLWLLARRHGFDALIGIAALAAALEVALGGDAAQAPRAPTWFAAPAVAAVVLVLLARRRIPFGAPACFWLLNAALSFADGRLVVFTVSVQVVGMASAFLLGNLRDEGQARVGLAIVVGSALIIVYNDPTHTAGEYIFIPVLFAILWLAGSALRERAEAAEAAGERAEQAEREREVATRIAIAEERARIARELHDVIAHAVSVMVLHVGAVRHKLPAERADDKAALMGVEQAGRTALSEMRHLLGALRHEDDDVDLAPQPGLDGLGELVEEVRGAGLDVRLHVDGEPVALPRALDLSAYRIVQEGLTNALKHARANHADVAVRYEPEALRIEVSDDGDGTTTSDGLGHGLIGIRERVKIYGGDMTAGAATAGGFVLRTRLPLRGDGR